MTTRTPDNDPQRYREADFDMTTWTSLAVWLLFVGGAAVVIWLWFKST